MINLLGNTIKFTDEGKVTVKVGLESLEKKRALLYFQVHDTGIGIHHDKQEMIFESFTQADLNTTRRYGGTGLGLPISRQLVELMDGRLWLESDPGNGTTFHFTVLLEITKASPKKNRP